MGKTDEKTVKREGGINEEMGRKKVMIWMKGKITFESSNPIH